MKELSSLVFLYAETPLHAGSGSALGAVDLPVQRERMSGLPMVQGSGIKGALRAELRDREAAEWSALDLALFGREPPKAEKAESAEEDREKDKAGALSVLDARLLLLPVRTVWGGFAWVTSPMILQRLVRDLEVAGLKAPGWQALRAEDDAPRVGAKPTVAKARDDKHTLLIEDLEYTAVSDPLVDTLAHWLAEHALPQTDAYKLFGARLAGQLVVVGDGEMKLLSERATEVVTRVRIDDKTGTVADGALWTEESLPAESLLWSLAFFADERPSRGQQGAREQSDVKTELRGGAALRTEISTRITKLSRIRLGGDRTVGRGIVGIRVGDGGAS